MEYKKVVKALSENSINVYIYRGDEEVVSKYFNPVDLSPPIIGMFIWLALGDNWGMQRLFKKANKWADKQIKILEENEVL